MLERKHCLIKFCYMLTDYGTALGGGNYEAEGDGRLYHGLQRRHLSKRNGGFQTVSFATLFQQRKHSLSVSNLVLLSR